LKGAKPFQDAPLLSVKSQKLLLTEIEQNQLCIKRHLSWVSCCPEAWYSTFLRNFIPTYQEAECLSMRLCWSDRAVSIETVPVIHSRMVNWKCLQTIHDTRHSDTECRLLMLKVKEHARYL